MALTPTPPRARHQRGGRARPLLALAVACLALRLCWASLGFAAGRAAAPSRPGSTPALRSRSRLAARGGDAAEAAVEAGDKVKAISPDDEQWYPGTIDKVNADGTFTVRWDDPDGGPETNDVGADALKKVIIFKDYKVGDDVRATSPDDGRQYPGVVAKANEDGSFQVKWDDPDGGPESNDVKPEDMKKVNVFKGYKVDDPVLAVFPEDGEMYPGTVVKVNDDGTFQVKWDDADGGPEESPCKPKDMKVPPIPFDKLEVGQKYTGTVRSIADFGAFVDIGAEGDGLVHISRIADARVDDVHDYLEEGQEVEVWVSGKRDDGRFGLTMIEGRMDGGGGGRTRDVTPFQDLSPDEWQTGTVSKIMPFGAFVNVVLPGGQAADGLVHISQIKDDFCASVEDEVEEGQEVKVRVLSVDMERGKMSLSMRQSGGGGGGGGAPRGPSDVSAFQSVDSQQWLVGKVARTASFGAFVTVTTEDGSASADGLVHITQIKDGFVESVEDELEPGQEVKVRVLNVDTDSGKMSLTMKSEDF